MQLKTLLCLAALAAPAVAQDSLPILRDYVKIPSVNPPADSRAPVAFLRSWLEREGIACETYGPSPDKQTLLARLPGRQRGTGLLLLHHTDVVPAEGERWPVDPFSAEVLKGFLYGRGTVDMKSIGVMQFLSLIALKRAGTPLQHDLMVMATPDEESGGEKGAQWMVQHHWDKLKPRYVLDEGGFGTHDLLSADNRLTFGVSVGEKKIVWVRLKATGVAGHGSQPTSENANDRLLRVLSRLPRPKPASSPLVTQLRRQMGKLADNKFTGAITRDTVTVTSLRSGVGEPAKINVIGSHAEASLDCRLLPETDAQAFIANLQKAVRSEPGVEMKVEYLMDQVPVSRSDTPVFAAIRDELQARHRGAIVVPYLVPFGTDSNTLRRAGAQAYGFNPMVLDASMVASMHSDAERIPVAAWEPAVATYQAVVRRYVTGP